MDAIATGGYDPALEPTFRKVRKAGILLISSGDDIAGGRDLWVNYSDPAAFARALADALASQIAQKGEYAILDEQGEFPIAHTWAKEVAAYIAKAYPNMKSDGLQTETGAGDEKEVDSVKSFMAAHPNLKGLIGIAPTEAYMAAEAIPQAGRIGQVFSAGNGGGHFKGTPLVGWVRSGAIEDVVVGRPDQARLPNRLGGELPAHRPSLQARRLPGRWPDRPRLVLRHTPGAAARPAAHHHQDERRPVREQVLTAHVSGASGS